MLDVDTQIARRFEGTSFDVIVWRCWLPNHHRAFIEVRANEWPAEIFEVGVECSANQLRELAELANKAAALIEQLDTATQPPVGVNPGVTRRPEGMQEA